MSENPWWHPTIDDLGRDDPLPPVIRLSPDYMAELPLWADGLGNLPWQLTKFTPELLDRLAAWQQEFDQNFHHESGWRSPTLRTHWAEQAAPLATAVQAELGPRAHLTIDLWPLQPDD